MMSVNGVNDVMSLERRQWWARVGVEFVQSEHGYVEAFWGGEWKVAACDWAEADKRMSQMLEEHLSKQPVHQGVYVGV
jgi:hypothetical protein